MATRTLEIVFAGDASSASRALQKVEQDSKRMGNRVDREGNRVPRSRRCQVKGSRGLVSPLRVWRRQVVRQWVCSRSPLSLVLPISRRA